MNEVTRILSAIEQGDAHAAGQLPLVYDELRKLAAQKLAQEKPGQTLQLRQVMKRFPAARKPVVATSWQFSPARAFFVAWDDNRRIVAVPCRGGQIDTSLERSLADPGLLKKYQSRYAFVKVGAEQAPPAEIQAAFKKAGAGGLVIRDCGP